MTHRIFADGATDDSEALAAAVRNESVIYDKRLYSPHESIRIERLMELSSYVYKCVEGDHVPEAENSVIAAVPLMSRRSVFVHPRQVDAINFATLDDVVTVEAY